MPNPQNIIGKGFDKNPQNIGKGRKKKIYTVIRELGYSADDVRTAFGEIGFYTQKEIVELAKDENKPMIVRIVANQFIQCFKSNDFNKIKEILEHVIGKPQQKIETENKTEITTNLDLSKLSYEQLCKLAGDNS
jgi:translation initiation factor 2 alpha subunit (eIF-2alpha)